MRTYHPQAKGDTLNISGDTYGNYSLEVLDDLPNRMRESFRLFMQDLHRNSTIGAMTYRSWCSSKTKFPGLPFWDDGQLTRCVRDMPEEKQAEISDSLGDPWEKVYTNVDCWVRTSTLTEDLTKCLLRFEALNPGSVWVDRLARLQGIHRNGGSRDHFEKLSCSDFYDEELRSSVEQRDKQLFESFGYSCCSRDIKPMRYPQGPLRSKPPVHPTAPPPPAATRTTEKDTVASNSAPGDKNRQTKPSGRSSTTPFVYFAPDLPSTRTSMARRGCRNQASVAICLIGDRLEGRKRANLHYHWMKNLIGPLGGAQNVEVIVHASKDDLDSDSFTEILDEWPTAIGIYREDEEDLYTVYQEESKACPGPFLTFSSWMQRLRKRDCYRAIREREMECNHHYRWVVRDQADHFFYKPVFAGGTRTLSSLEEGIHVAGLTRRWMNHRFGIVSRDYAPHYFAAKRGACTHPNATELFTAPCLWDRKVDAKSPASRVDPGCDLVMGITHELGQQHAEGSGKGRAVGHFVRGKTVTRPLLVRGCEHDECDVAKCNSNPTCKMKVEALREAAKNDSDATARMMKVLDRSWVVCEQEVPGSHAACAPPFY
uniref:Uncharacterized protein n=1 Tax=Lotharella globosa TaxID=91324 RepID=A0A7S3ZIQ9_9EUKA